jgi:hypothetical protein
MIVGKPDIGKYIRYPAVLPVLHASKYLITNYEWIQFPQNPV